MVLSTALNPVCFSGMPSYASSFPLLGKLSRCFRWETDVVDYLIVLGKSFFPVGPLASLSSAGLSSTQDGFRYVRFLIATVNFSFRTGRGSNPCCSRISHGPFLTKSVKPVYIVSAC